MRSPTRETSSPSAAPFGKFLVTGSHSISVLSCTAAHNLHTAGLVPVVVHAAVLVDAELELIDVAWENQKTYPHGMAKFED